MQNWAAQSVIEVAFDDAKVHIDHVDKRADGAQLLPPLPQGDLKESTVNMLHLKLANEPATTRDNGGVARFWLTSHSLATRIGGNTASGELLRACCGCFVSCVGSFPPSFPPPLPPLPPPSASPSPPSPEPPPPPLSTMVLAPPPPPPPPPRAKPRPPPPPPRPIQRAAVLSVPHRAPPPPPSHVVRVPPPPPPSPKPPTFEMDLAALEPLAATHQASVAPPLTGMQAFLSDPFMPLAAGVTLLAMGVLCLLIRICCCAGSSQRYAKAVTDEMDSDEEDCMSHVSEIERPPPGFVTLGWKKQTQKARRKRPSRREPSPEEGPDPRLFSIADEDDM